MAEMSIEYPNISEQSPEGQLQQVKDYLFLLADKLNLQDNSAEKIFQEVSKAIDADAVATQDNEQSAKLREYANLKALIVKTGEYAMTHSEEISKVFNSSFGANSDFGKYYEELERRVTENAQGVEDLFTYTAGINNENGNFGVGTKQFIKSGLLYYDESQIPVFGVGVGVISTVATDEDKVIDLKQNRLATFAADEIAFWDNGNKVAYISGNAINFPAANIRGGSIHIGEEEHNFFKVDTSGNLQIGDYFSVSSAGLAKFQSADGKLSLDLSAGEISSEGIYADTVIGGDGIVFKKGDSILGQIDAVDSGSGLVVLSSTAKFGEFKVFQNGNVYGSFEYAGSSGARLKAGSVQLIDYVGNDVPGIFYFDESEGRSKFSVNEIYVAYSPNATGIRLASNGSGGEITLANYNGNKIAEFKAITNGSILNMGNASDGVWTIAQYDGNGRHVHADHFHFHNKSDGLITGGVPADECSAYIVIGKAKSGNLPVSVIIPSDIAEDYQWQLADDEGFTSFYISDGQAYVDGDYGNGSIIATYSIR